MVDNLAIELPPTSADVRVACAIARRVTPTEERTVKVLTWLADEHIVIGGAVLLAGYYHFFAEDAKSRRRANHVLLSSVVACVVPHLLKRVVDRKRPDRTVVHGRRNGIPRSGKPWDSFPSGHSVQIGALAMALQRMGPRQLRPVVWSLGLALASTRLVLLAHYVSDVIAGLVIGVTVEGVLHKITRC